MTGRIFDIKRFAIHDGPGIRTTVFLKGCPLRCLWCQNPEGIDAAPGMWIKREQCLRCGACAAHCPGRALSLEAEGVRISREACRLCGACAERCPSRAIQRIDEEVDAEALAEELIRDKLFFDVSGGGVTLSGGEPLAQSDFTLTLLGLLKKRGVHTCVETSLFAPEETIRRLAPALDFLICDIKLIDDEAHRKYTGQSNALILNNFRRFARSFPRVLVRVPLIPGITAEENNLRAVGDLVRSAGPGIDLELLNYNWFSGSKYVRLDRPHFNLEARAFPEETLARFYSWAGAEREAAPDFSPRR